VNKKPRKEDSDASLAILALFSAVSHLGLIYVVASLFKWYYAFYALSFREIVDGYLILLLGFLIGVIRTDIIPKKPKFRKIFIGSVLFDFFFAISLKLLFFLSPSLIVVRYGGDALKENIAILTNASLFEQEQFKAILLNYTAPLVLLPSFFIVALIVIMLFENPRRLLFRSHYNRCRVRAGERERIYRRLRRSSKSLKRLGERFS